MGMFWFFFEFQFLMEKSNKWNFRLDLVYAEMSCWNTVEIGQGQMGDLPMQQRRTEQAFPGQAFPPPLLSVQSLCPVPLFVPHGLQQVRLPCPSPTPEAYSNSCPLSW